MRNGTRFWARYNRRWVLKAIFLSQADADRWMDGIRDNPGLAQRDSAGVPFYYLQRPRDPSPSRVYPRGRMSPTDVS